MHSVSAFWLSSDMMDGSLVRYGDEYCGNSLNMMVRREKPSNECFVNFEFSGSVLRGRKRGQAPKTKWPEGCGRKRGQAPKKKWPEGCFAFLGPDPFSAAELLSGPRE